MAVTVASFDLGIKNLSYCVATFDASGSLVRIDRWANLNLLADGADSQSQTRCGALVAGKVCGGPASWSDRRVGATGAAATTDELTLLCKRCAKKSAKAPLELEKPKLADWRTWAAATFGLTEVEAKRLSKATIEERAATVRLMPYKAPKAKGVSLQALLAAMEKCLDVELPYLALAGRIRLENQPSEFAPHMKSIQIMLFALIDHRLRREYSWSGAMEFVNAAVKTRGAAVAAGKENKRMRKLAGIARVTDVLVKAGVDAQLAWWKGQAKQDDLADALLMCLDAVSEK
jgi:hypothetical protein